MHNPYCTKPGLPTSNEKAAHSDTDEVIATQPGCHEKLYAGILISSTMIMQQKQNRRIC
jgi:hypothetical protein